jgi:hypothetical protein
MITRPWKVALLVFLSSAPAFAAAQKGINESGEFKIYAGGREVGAEKYAIVGTGDAVTSTSTLQFRNPGESHQKITLESKLEMNARFVPKTYSLKSDVEGKVGTIAGEFAPNQAMFLYDTGTGEPRKSGLLVGNEYSLLDTNIFHHFVFLARLFNYDRKDKPQRFEVVVPQEQESGFVSISALGKEDLDVRGKKLDTHHLQIDSGALKIQMWVDNQRIVQKITVPGRGIEVLRAR